MGGSHAGGRPDHRSDAGFTLIELLITIVILSVLAGIVVFGVGRFRGDSVSSACKADLKIVSAAASAFDLQVGTFPTTVAELEQAGYVKDPPSDATYTFDPKAKRVQPVNCTL